MSPDRRERIFCGFSSASILAAAIAWTVAGSIPRSLAADQILRVELKPQWLMKTWQAEDGLPENSATSMVQTPDGYLWFGTFEGLVRFNSVDFKVFNPQNTPQLPSGGIVHLHLDRKGRLWVSTYRGLVVKEGEKWRLRSELGDEVVRTLTERANGDFLITSFDGKLFEYSNDRFSELPAPGEKGFGYFGAVDEEGRWWVVQNRFVGRWVEGHWESMLPKQDLGRDQVACGAARDGGMWLVLGEHLLKIRNGKEVQRIKLSEMPGGVWTLTEDSGGDVWISTYNRGVCHVAADGKVTRWDGSNGLSDNGRFLFEDRERNLWVGTSGHGLTRLTRRRFQQLGIEEAGAVAVQSIAVDHEDRLWAATYGQGLLRLSGSQAVRIPVPPKDSQYLQSVLVDRKGRVWVGTFQHGLWVIDHEGARRIPDEQTGTQNVIALFEDSAGRLWASAGNVVAVSNGETFRRLGPEDGFLPGEVNCFAEDSAGSLWLSNGSGIYRRRTGRKFEEVKGMDGGPIQNVICLKSDPDGTMWMGSSDRGLLRWRKDALATVASEAKFPDQPVQSILEDGSGFFWITSAHNVIRAHRDDLNASADTGVRLKCQIFAQGDGLPKANFSRGRQPLSARDAEGRLWFAGSKGVITTKPSELKLNEKPPTVRIESLVYHAPSDGQSNKRAAEMRLEFPFTNKVVLPAGSRRIEVHYAALSFSTPEKVRFQVKIEGQDADWQDLAGRRTAYFDELSPGKYTFQVRAANGDGFWSNGTSALSFVVLPYFWQTTWFRGLIVFSLFGEAGLIALLLANRRRLGRTQSALQESQRRIELATSAARLGLLVWDIENNGFWINEEGRALFGWTQREHVDIDRFVNALHPDDREQARRTITGSMKEGTTYEEEYRLIVNGGTTRWVAVRGQVEFNRAKKAPFLMRGALADVTARKEAEADAQRQRAELAHVARVSTMGELAASLAHEINQPLGAILSNAEAAEILINQNPPALDEVREILADIRTDDERAGEVIRRMRALLRKREMEFQELDLNSVVEDVLRFISGDAALRKTSISAELSPRLPRVRGDRVHLQQVLLNLAMNAMEAMLRQPADKRRLIVRSSANGMDSASLVVSDTGEGISPGQLPHLFEPFYTTKPNGMGMGLSIARTIVEVHRGRIQATNNPHGGATFTVTLPTLPPQGPI